MYNPHIDWRTKEIQFVKTSKSNVKPERQPEEQPKIIKI